MIGCIYFHTPNKQSLSDQPHPNLFIDEVDDVKDGDVCDEVDDVENGNVCDEVEDVENATGQQFNGKFLE